MNTQGADDRREVTEEEIIPVASDALVAAAVEYRGMRRIAVSELAIGTPARDPLIRGAVEGLRAR
jgi:hypothetical protein